MWFPPAAVAQVIAVTARPLRDKNLNCYLKLRAEV
jgi:hypothetical protein